MSLDLKYALEERLDEVSKVFSSLSHPVRLRILCALIDGRQSVNALKAYCETSQSSMSQYLGRMKDEGILKCERQGHQIFYEIADDRMFDFLKSVKKIYCS